MTSVPPFVAALLSFADGDLAVHALKLQRRVRLGRGQRAQKLGILLAPLSMCGLDDWIAACSSWISWSYLFTCVVSAAACASSPARALDPFDTSDDVTKTTSWLATALANASAARGEEPVAVICTRFVAMAVALDSGSGPPGA